MRAEDEGSGDGGVEMTQYNILVDYQCRAWVSVEAKSKEDAEQMLADSVALEDYATVENMLDSEIEVVKFA